MQALGQPDAILGPECQGSFAEIGNAQLRIEHLQPGQVFLRFVRPAEQRAFVRCLELIAEELGNACDV